MKRQEGGGANFTLDITSPSVCDCGGIVYGGLASRMDCEWLFHREVAAIVWRNRRMHGSNIQRKIQPALLQNEASRTLTCSREARRIGRIGLARSAQQSGMCCDLADVIKAAEAQESRGVQTIIYDNAEFAEMAPAKCMKTIGVDF